MIYVIHVSIQYVVVDALNLKTYTVLPNERQAAVSKCKAIVFGKLEDAVRIGRGGKEREWTDCVQSDVRAFSMAGDWKTTALKAEVWVETATEMGGGSWPCGRKMG